MRYITPPNLAKRAPAYVGKRVRTTGNDEGEVIEATAIHGVIRLLCKRDDGSFFISDNEHATIWEPRHTL